MPQVCLHEFTGHKSHTPKWTYRQEEACHLLNTYCVALDNSCTLTTVLLGKRCYALLQMRALGLRKIVKIA